MLNTEYLIPGMPYADISPASNLAELASVDAEIPGTGIPLGILVACVLVGVVLANTVGILRSAFAGFRRVKEEVRDFNDGYLPRF